MSPSSREDTQALSREIDRVKNLIEQCLMHYMNKKEVLRILHQQKQIEPFFTKIVWQNLEEQNQEFFRAYYVRVILKEQIKRFNHLLEKQVEMMKQLNTDKVALPPLCDETNLRPPMQPVPIDLPPSGFNNCGQSQHSGVQHASSSSFDSLSLAQNLNVEMIPPPSGFNNCGQFIHSGIQHASSSKDSPSLAHIPDVEMMPPTGFNNCGQSIHYGIQHADSLLAHNLNVGMTNEIPINNEWEYMGNLTINNASASSFNYMDPNLLQSPGLDSLLVDLTTDHNASVFNYMDPNLLPFPISCVDNLSSPSGGTIENQGENTRQPDLATNLDY